MIVYIYKKNFFGLGKTLRKIAGVSEARVLKNQEEFKNISGKGKNQLVIVPPVRDGLKLVTHLRQGLSSPVPILLLSFRPQEKIEKRINNLKGSGPEECSLDNDIFYLKAPPTPRELETIIKSIGYSRTNSAFNGNPALPEIPLDSSPPKDCEVRQPESSYRETPTEKIPANELVNILDQPAIHTISVTQNTRLGLLQGTQREWNSFFAFSVESTGKYSERNLREVQELNSRVLSWWIRQPDDGRGLSLRYLFDPEKDRFQIAIIGKIPGDTREESNEKSLEIHQNLRLLLTGQSAYKFKTISQKEDLISLLEPFTPVGHTSIHREGVLLETDERQILTVHPFQFNPHAYLDNLIQVLMSQKHPTLLNAALFPVSYFPEELNWIPIEIKRFVETKRLDSFSERVWNKALGLAEEQVRSLENGCLLGKLDVVSAGKIPSALLETIRFDFFGSLGKMETISENHPQVGQMWDHIKMIHMDKPKKSGQMLQDLVDLSQAKCIFQLPIPTQQGVPGIKTETLKIIPVPQQFKKDFQDTRNFLVAEGFHGDQKFPVRLPSEDLMKHLYICGRTGSGKSTLLYRLALSLANLGKGFCLIDPHGDLSQTLFHHLPKNRKDDVVFFDPIDPESRVQLNFLENDGTESQQSRISQEFLRIIFQLYPPQHMGSISERSITQTLLLAMNTGKTLADLVKIWTDEDFREECLKNLPENLPSLKETRHFWKMEHPNMRRGDWAGMETYIVSKLTRFSTDEAMRRTLSAPQSTIDFDGIVNNNKILLVRLPKGPLGEMDAYMLGMVVLFKIRQAAMRRGNMPEKERRDFYFILDEFQNFVSSGGLSYHPENDTGFSSLISEARKFKIGMILANQYVHQLGQDIKNAVFGNIQSRIFFGVGAEDAGYIKQQIPHGPDVETLVTCPNYYAYAQLSVNGEQAGPFTIKTIPPYQQGTR
ncbi:hypothetical protein UR09_06285 [Candidatus Nitromaritima sp. SCGC AAA799-A02]|nr:hypothetical protein UR09_06285 [Candidatus Nitromaritima sp. SCGC AAA799-A02]